METPKLLLVPGPAQGLGNLGLGLSPHHKKIFTLYKKGLHPEATMFATDIGVQDVIFESDSRIACHALADPTNAPTSISTIVAGTSVRLHEFRTFGIAHVRRQANKSAHALAAYAKETLTLL